MNFSFAKASAAWLAVLVMIGLPLLAGCARKTKASAANGPAASQPAKPAWNWDHHPLMIRMRLGTLPCQLQPKSMITVHSPLLGILRVYVNTPQTNLPSNFLWAEFEPEIFAAEEKSLEEALKKINDRELMQREIEVPRQKLQLERQLEEAQRQVSYMRLLSTNKEFADLILNPGGSSPLRPDALHKSELELGLLTRTMSLVQATNLTALGIDIEGQRTEWERRKLEFERRRVQSRFRMPFDGKLTVSLPVTEGVTEYPVASGQEIGIIRDLSTIRIRVPIANVSWTAIPGEKLTAVVRMPSGEGIEAEFAYQKIERVQNREESVYYFEFPKERSATASRLIGTDVGCELWVKLDEPLRVVPKLALVLHNPEAFQNRSWAMGISTAFPGSRLVVEGQSDIGIAPPKTMALSQVKK